MSDILKKSKKIFQTISDNNNSYIDNMYGSGGTFDIIYDNTYNIVYETIYNIIIDCISKCNEQHIIQQINENNCKHKIIVKNIRRCDVSDYENKTTKRNYIITIITYENIDTETFMKIINECIVYKYFTILSLEKKSDVQVIHTSLKNDKNILPKSNIQKNYLSEINKNQENKFPKIAIFDDTFKNKKIQNNDLTEINNINQNDIDLNSKKINDINSNNFLDLNNKKINNINQNDIDLNSGGINDINPNNPSDLNIKTSKLKEENNNIIKSQEQDISISNLKQNIKNLNEHYNQFLKINETITNDIKILEEYLTKKIYI